MSPSDPIPREICRLGVRAVRIDWGGGHQAEYGNRYLRDNCPCAECREKPTKALPIVGQSGPGGEDLYPIQMATVGSYAISMQWSDGHDAGIYSYRTLLDLCPCRSCVGQATPAGVEQ